MMGQNRSTAVMQRRHEGQDSLDYFPTPPWATRALIQKLAVRGLIQPDQRCWEPACGAGDMARPLAEYFAHVHASDVALRGCGEQGDFLWPGGPGTFHWIITNPPFRLASQFADTALARARCGVALLVRSAFLEGIARLQDLFRPRPPRLILQFAERLPMIKGRLDEDASSATAYCWVVWHDGTDWPGTEFNWIGPCRKSLERPGDYGEAT
jgi:hypothetical protein